MKNITCLVGSILILSLFAACTVSPSIEISDTPEAPSETVDTSQVSNTEALLQTTSPALSPSQAVYNNDITFDDLSEPKIADNIHEINEAVLQKIAEAYFITFGFDEYFSEDDLLDYGKVFSYISYGGVYRLNPFNPLKMPEVREYFDATSSKFMLPADVVDALVEKGEIVRSEIEKYKTLEGIYIIDSFFWNVKPELHQYFNEDTWMLTLPTKTVDDYILKKFNTVLDRSKIPEGITYDKIDETYTFQAFTGDFYYNLVIDEQIKIDESVVRFICTATLDEDVQDSPRPSHQVAFTISLIDGEYRYLSVEQQLSPAEKYLAETSEEDIFEYFYRATEVGTSNIFGFGSPEEISSFHLYRFAILVASDAIPDIDSNWYNENEKKYYIPLSDITDILNIHFDNYSFVPTEVGHDYNEETSEFEETALGFGSGAGKFAFVSATATDDFTIEVIITDELVPEGDVGPVPDILVRAKADDNGVKFTYCGFMNNSK